MPFSQSSQNDIKGIVHFEIHFWYVLAYFKGIQDVAFFFSCNHSHKAPAPSDHLEVAVVT